MKAVGIIAEYNPFHSGHAYQIRRARELSGAEYVIIVMSPDFVQRGSAAVLDKWTRARMALLGGADLVLELPVCYACASAEYFAEGGVSLLSSLNVADTLAFGTESEDSRVLEEAADFFSLPRDQEPSGYKELLQEKLKAGMTYPAARVQAYVEYRDAARSSDSTPSGSSSYRSVQKQLVQEQLSLPNNILAVEYLKAIRRLHASLRPLPIRRYGEGYHGRSRAGEGSPGTNGFLSAETIRRILEKEDSGRRGRESMHPSTAGLYGDFSMESPEISSGLLPGALPDAALEILRQAADEGALLFDRDLDILLQMRLCELAAPEETGSCGHLSEYLDVTPDMENRIRNNLDHYQSFSQFTGLIKTRQMTETRIRRALLHILLGIRASDMEHFRADEQARYARILGFRKTAAPLLHEMKRKSDIPIVSNVPDALHRFPDSECGDIETGKSALPPQNTCRQMLLQTLYASRIRNLALQCKTGRSPVPEYRRRPVIV